MNNHKTTQLFALQSDMLKHVANKTVDTRVINGWLSMIRSVTVDVAVTEDVINSDDIESILMDRVEYIDATLALVIDIVLAPKAAQAGKCQTLLGYLDGAARTDPMHIMVSRLQQRIDSIKLIE